MKICDDCFYKEKCKNEYDLNELNSMYCNGCSITVGDLLLLEEDKLDYQIKLHDEEHTPAIYYMDYEYSSYPSLKVLGVIYDTTYCHYDDIYCHFLFDGKRNYTVKDFISQINKNQIEYCTEMYDYYADGLGTEGIIDDIKIDDVNKMVFLTRR